MEFLTQADTQEWIIMGAVLVLANWCPGIPWQKIVPGIIKGLLPKSAKR
jgi:hypothetical protein